ncbi:redoxin family protein [Streptomyces sp. RFCAC02]|uniref:redoxin family protein n=1 Tax=Streptomyces sp. RFCAC02 TaxID=2499143 RepID=UPI0010222779|nr:redoxin family protein [Streptomyces sp. RFCAC02]
MTTEAVRSYESPGLLAPARLANGYRNYDERDVRLTRAIRALADLGIPAEGTRPFLECLALGHWHADDCPAALARYRDDIDELTQRIDGLTARRNGRFPPATMGEEPMTDRTSLPAGLPVPEDDGAAAHLPGMEMPHLELRGTDGATVRLDALGAGRTVLYLYPLTGRPGTDLPEGWNAIPGARGCTAEACGFRDHHQDLHAAGAARVFGLSSQDTDYQREVTERLRLPFRMLSDPARDLGRALHLPTFRTADGPTLYKRLTLIVRDDLIEHVFYPVFPPDEHADQVLAWLGDNPL